MSDEFYLSRKNYPVLELEDLDAEDANRLQGETLSQRSGRVLGKALGSSYVVMDSQPLEAVGSVPMSTEEITIYKEELVPFIEASAARLKERIQERENAQKALGAQAVDASLDVEPE